MSEGLKAVKTKKSSGGIKNHLQIENLNQEHIVRLSLFL